MVLLCWLGGWYNIPISLIDLRFPAKKRRKLVLTPDNGTNLDLGATFCKTRHMD